MQRIPEPELMLDHTQALAYAQADFSIPHDLFIELFADRAGSPGDAEVLDLGCGPGDICRRFARRFPDSTVLGVDGSEPMLSLGQAATRAAGLEDRIRFRCGRLPDVDLPERFEFILSNSLLHHLHDPNVLWQSLHRYGKPSGQVFIMDLMRPDSLAGAKNLVHEYAASEPALLQHDFYHSLLAAWRPDEIALQLQDQHLDQLQIEVVSDRHFIVYGQLH